MTTPAPPVPRAIATEKKTVAAMVRIYCAEHHDGADAPCAACAALQRYSHARLDACPYGADKPTCKACPIHCYKPAEREAMRDVMRFAGDAVTVFFTGRLYFQSQQTVARRTAQETLAIIT